MRAPSGGVRNKVEYNVRAGMYVEIELRVALRRQRAEALDTAARDSRIGAASEPGGYLRVGRAGLNLYEPREVQLP